MLSKKRPYVRKTKVDWDVGPDYEIIRPIGTASSISVCEALKLSTGEIVAIKRLSGIFDEPLRCKQYLREISIMRRLKHPNVAKIITLIPHKIPEHFNELFAVMEYVPSDLQRFIKNPIYLSEDHIQLIFYNILCGLNYLHSANILHRDLNPANILLYNDCEVKISDFGLSRTIPRSKQFTVLDSQHYGDTNTSQNHASASFLRRSMTRHFASNWYRAPELLLLENNYRKPIDIWSLGCILGELSSLIKGNTPASLDRHPLLKGNSTNFLSSSSKNEDSNKSQVKDWDQVNLILEVTGTPSVEELGFITDKNSAAYLRSFETKQRKNLAEKYPYSSPSLVSIMEGMLQFDPRRRLSVKEALSHSYFDNIRDLEKEKDAHFSLRFDFDDREEVTCEELRPYFLREILEFTYLDTF